MKTKIGEMVDSLDDIDVDNFQLGKLLEYIPPHCN